MSLTEHGKRCSQIISLASIHKLTPNHENSKGSPCCIISSSNTKVHYTAPRHPTPVRFQTPRCGVSLFTLNLVRNRGIFILELCSLEQLSPIHFRSPGLLQLRPCRRPHRRRGHRCEGSVACRPRPTRCIKPQSCRTPKSPSL